MATSAYPTFKSYDPMTQMVLHASLKVAQVGGILVPPLYLVSSLLIRRGAPFSIRRLMRASTSGALIGAGLGAAMGYGRLRNEPQVALEDRVFRLAHNAGQLRTDDYSIIGASLGAVLSPAIFLRRAPFLSLVLGGASIGLGAGTVTHIVRMVTQGEDVRPEGMVGEIPVLGGNEKK